MANSIKESGGGLALQITGPARDAELVRENTEGKATWLAQVYVYGFEGLLVVIDSESVSPAERAEIVATAVQGSGGIYRGEVASVEPAGNGYQVQLPGAAEAGFDVGDTAPVILSSGLVVIHDGDRAKLADSVSVVRDNQLVS
jgi:RNA polymerase subunit RPABC4/transcription elongation factor Spt4